MDLRELLRYLQTTANLSAIQRATGLNRRTIRRYRHWAVTHGLLDQPLPAVEVLQPLMARTLELSPPPQTVSSVEPYREVVTQLQAQGVAGTAILQRLRERGYTGTLSSLSRVVHRLEPHRPSATVRVEREPGSEAQVDVGSAGRMRDPVTGALRKTWAFVMLLAYSRHQYVGSTTSHATSWAAGCRR
jgi:transposase